MFETLDTIKWSQVESCYSRSNEIPAAIRGLVSDDAAVRQEAFGTLWSNLEHQGSVYEASALAVPFLLEILAAHNRRTNFHWSISSPVWEAKGLTLVLTFSR